MKRKIYNLKTLACCLLSIAWASQADAQHVTLDWAKAFTSDSSFNWGMGITTDEAGNIYTTGKFSKTIDFDPGPNVYNLTAEGLTDAYVTKSDAEGNLIWARRFGGTIEDDAGEVIAVDKNGNVYCVGIFYGSVNFDPNGNNGWLTSYPGYFDPYICKLDSSGNFVWAKSLYGPLGEGIVSIEVDEQENVYLFGLFSGTVDFDPGVGTHYLTSNETSHFLLKLKANGDFDYVKAFLGDGFSFTGAMTLAPSGNIYITSTFMVGSVKDYDPGAGVVNLSSVGMMDYCVVRLDNDGNFVWAKQMPGTDFGAAAYPMGIGVDSRENIIVSGGYEGSIDFDPGAANFNLTASGMQDIFVAKLDSSGGFVWATTTKGTLGAAAETYGLKVDKRDNIYITGQFSKSIDFDPGAGIDLLSMQGSNTPYNNAFISKTNADGTYAWTKQIGGGHSAIGNGIQVDGSGSVYTTGMFMDTCDFDPNSGVFPLSSNLNYTAIYIQKLLCTDTNSSVLDITAECDGYLFGGETLLEDGVYSYKETNMAGCDSTIVLNLTINKLNALIAVDSFILRTVESYPSYQWLLNGLPIQGATDSFYRVEQNGQYQVVVISERGCTDTSDVYTITNVSVKEVSSLAASIHIYPNPTTDVVFVEAPIAVNLTIIDIAGKPLHRAAQTRSISFQDYASGVYLLEITDNNGNIIKTEKVIKR